MTKESFKASRIVIKDIPKDYLVSVADMKRITGGMSFRPDFLSEEWLILTQRSSGTGVMLPSSLASNGNRLIISVQGRSAKTTI